MEKIPPFRKNVTIFIVLLTVLVCLVLPVSGDEEGAGLPETTAPPAPPLNITNTTTTALDLSLAADPPAGNLTAAPAPAIALADGDPITHPRDWYVSYLGTGNYTSLLDIPEIGAGDTIRIWGTVGHTYEGGVTIDAPDVTVKQWDGSPAQPLITNTSGTMSAFTVTADNATFRGLNISENQLNGNGAGIHAAGTDGDHVQRLTIADCTFAGNNAKFGALYAGYVDDLSVEGTAFTGNTATLDGGGAYLDHCNYATLTDTTFTNNTASNAAGGALFYLCDCPTFTTATLTGNNATYGGGALFDSCNYATLTTATLTGNTADIDGGGAIFGGCPNATVSGATFTNNTAHSDGGGAEFYNCDDATVTGVTFTNNTATGKGGGAFFYGCANAMFTTATFTGNTARYGGGSYFDSCPNATFINAILSGNTATLDGGGAYFGSCRNATLTGAILSGNSAQAVGGGSYFDSCPNATLTNATFTNNTAQAVGGAYFGSCPNATLTDTTFTNNNAKGGNGGGVLFYLCDRLTFTTATLTNNTATGKGGGAHFGWCDNATLTNVTLADNTAIFGGGADFAYTDATLTNATFTNNTAIFGGGAYFDSDCTDATVSGATFTNNSATYGGGAYLSSENATFTDATFTGNTGTNYGGGAYFYWCTDATVSGATFTGNVAGSDGGGAYFYCTPATVTNCRFDNPTNIYAEGSTAVLNTTRTLGTNIAGGPYLGGNLWLQDPDQNISEWCADDDLDGICNETLTISGFGTDYLPLVYGRGTVLVDATPTGGFVFVDGTNTTRTANNTFYLPAGSHTLEVFGATAYGRAMVDVTAGTVENVTVIVLEPPVAGFTSTPTEGNAPLMVTFTDASTGDVTAWSWDFGDGNISAEQNLTHTYASAGTYTVSLNASNAYKFNVSTVPDAVRVLPALVAGFTSTPTEGNAPLNVTFTDASTGNVTAWSWDFGDGNTSIEQNPSHEYVTAGTYAVRLNASNAYGFSLLDSGVTVLAPPKANFTLSTDEGNAPLTVNFTDTSTGNVTAWSWDFGDGNTSTEQNPSHEYVTAGTYAVRLNTSNAYGFSLSDSGVTVLAPPAASFRAKTGADGHPLAVAFTDTSTGNITARSWDFGDGAASTEPNPVHTYAAFGIYTVTLTVQNAYDTNTTSAAVTLTAPSPSGGRSTASAGSTGEIRAGESASLTIQDSAISEVRVTAAETIRKMLVTLGRTGLPAGVPAPAGAVYEYDEVTLYETTGDAISAVVVFFSVPKTWLEEQGLDPADVTLYRYDDGAWHALPTEVVGEDATFWYFSATSPGFFLFAIGGDPSTPVSTSAMAPAAPVETVETLTTSPPAAGTTPSETPAPIPAMPLILGGAAALLIGGFVIWKMR